MDRGPSSQKVMIKTIHKKKKCKKAKWLSEEALQIGMKRRDTKSKGEKERHTHLNAEFQRIARRVKKAFLSDQRKEIEESNRMGKTSDLFKKIRDKRTPDVSLNRVPAGTDRSKNAEITGSHLLEDLAAFFHASGRPRIKTGISSRRPTSMSAISTILLSGERNS